MDYVIDDDPARVDLDVVWGFLSNDAYWMRWRSRDDVERAISDGVAVAYLADVFVLPAHRGHGLGQRIVGAMIDDGPGARFRWMLHTEDAHDLYRKYGFTEPDYKSLERPSQR